ncbi:hypothetical protein AUJ46_06655 [Candidatus Peregrinibacteria bacterium CG1_02_54_53]|nr:MAG: hypothetical protein AUJ46_06655 [Candidatus Peregrinibacteria bacterium CG1_02_54_53]
MSVTWIGKLDLRAALRRIQKESRQGKDFCLDPMRFEDLSDTSVADKLIKKILNELNSLFFAGELICADVPKQNYVLRPAARPLIKDWILYDALVHFIVSQIYKNIPDRSFSFPRFIDLVEGKRRPSSIGYWKDFENEAFRHGSSGKYKFLLTTDIVSFLSMSPLVC